MESWIPVAIMLVVLPPIGLIMLAKRFQNLTREQSADRRSKSSSSAGWTLMVLGFVLYFLGFRSFIPMLFLAAGGLGLLSYSGYLGRSRRRFDKYLAVVGNRKVMRVRDIAAAIPVSEEQACKDLELMIAEGRFPEGAYLDMSTRALVIDGAAVEPMREIKLSFEPEPVRAEPPRPQAAKPAAQSAPEPKPESPQDPYAQKLAEIRRMDDLIENEEVSAKIRRIEEVTKSIFVEVRQNPDKLGQINTFMNYYLPTTLKLLSAYSQLEKQAVAGENIRVSRERIEKMLSQLVFAFEQQLDQMFEADALDISSDITVLEHMMAKDGLSENNPYALPKCPPKPQPASGGAAQAVAPWDSRAAGSAAQAAREDEA